jgi:23S rRNA pseudouridine2457 synthase
MTSDGKKSNEINQSGMEKQYLAQLDGIIGNEAIIRLNKGVEIPMEGKRYMTKPAKVHVLKTAPQLPVPSSKLRLERHRPCSWISITLTEGKYRQVRKMTAAVGFPTLRLIRIRIGSIHIDDLVPGDVKELVKLI